MIEIKTEEQLQFATNAKQAILQANQKEKLYSDTLKSNPGDTIKKCVEHEIPSKYCYFGKHQVSSETQLLDLLRTDIFETGIECDLFTHMLTSKVVLLTRGDLGSIHRNVYWCKNELKDYYINECKSDPKDCGIPNYMSLNLWEQLIGVYESKHDGGADIVLRY